MIYIVAFLRTLIIAAVKLSMHGIRRMKWTKSVAAVAVKILRWLVRRRVSSTACLHVRICSSAAYYGVVCIYSTLHGMHTHAACIPAYACMIDKPDE